MAIVKLSATGALNTLPTRAGLSRRKVSEAMGRDPHYLSSTIQRKSTPTTHILSLVAKVCGYTLALIPSDKEIPDGSIVIEPSE